MYVNTLAQVSSDVYLSACVHICRFFLCTSLTMAEKKSVHTEIHVPRLDNPELFVH